MTDLFLKDCGHHEVINDSISIHGPKFPSMAEESDRVIDIHFSSKAGLGVGS